MSHTFLIIALTTGIFLIQFILSIFFGDLDADVDVDTDISSVVSFKGLPLRNRIRLVYVSGGKHGNPKLRCRYYGRVILCFCRLVSV